MQKNSALWILRATDGCVSDLKYGSWTISSYEQEAATTLAAAGWSPITAAVLCSRGEIDTRTLPGEASYIAGGSYYVLDAAGVCETVNACCNPYQQAVAVSNLYIRVG